MKEKYYCYIPFEGITIDPKGRAQLCPVWAYDEEHIQHDFTKSHKNIEDIFNSDKMKNIRQKMLKDEFVQACDICYQREAEGVISHRLKYADSRNVTFKEKIFKTSPPKLKPKIKHMDISFSNQCNLGCVMCNSVHSSHWAQQEKSMPSDLFSAIKDNYGILEFKSVILQQITIDSILNNINNLELLVIKGGEPLYDKNCLAFLDKIGDIKPNIRIKMVSNLTEITNKTLKTFDNLNNLYICPSIDGVNETYEWIRGTSFNNMMKNFEILHNHDSVKRMGINYTMSIYNIGNIIETITHFSQYDIDISFYPAREAYLNSNLLPNLIKETLLQKINKKMLTNIDPEKKLPYTPDSLHNIHNMLNLNNKPKDLKLSYQQFIKFTNWMNTVRGFNIQDVAPHIFDTMVIHNDIK